MRSPSRLHVVRDVPAAALLAAVALLFVSAAPATARVSGDYLEARTADVWTGPCFANGQVGLQGKEAVLAWRVDEGRFEDADLSGLGVVAVLRAESTLGDPHARSPDRESVLLVDERADRRQRRVLERLARELAGSHVLGRVVDVRAEPMRWELGGHGEAALRVGEAPFVAEVRTRCLHSHDAHCGNESVYYPPLTASDSLDVSPAYVEAHAWRGEGLGLTWSAPHARSAFLGRFEHVSPRTTVAAAGTDRPR